MTLFRPAIMGKGRAWREIQNLYMRFVILKVKIRSYALFRGDPLSLQLIRLDPGSDQPGLINLAFYTGIT